MTVRQLHKAGNSLFSAYPASFASTSNCETRSSSVASSTVKLSGLLNARRASFVFHLPIAQWHGLLFALVGRRRPSQQLHLVKAQILRSVTCSLLLCYLRERSPDLLSSGASSTTSGERVISRNMLGYSPGGQPSAGGGSTIAPKHSSEFEDLRSYIAGGRSTHLGRATEPRSTIDVGSMSLSGGRVSPFKRRISNSATLLPSA